MSFLNSVLSSIETGDVPAPPPAAQRSEGSTSTTRTATTSTPSRGSAVDKGPSLQNEKRPLSSQKRKAEAHLHPASRQEKAARLSSARSSSQKVTPTPSSKSPNVPNAPNTQSKQPVDSKPPPKGSYADIMAQAKALQTKAPTSVGMIRHQMAPKERLSKVQQKRLAKEAKQREQETKKGGSANGGRPTSSGASTTAGRLHDTKSKAAEKPAGPEYKGTARRPPEEPVYKGTAGKMSRSQSGKGNARRDSESRRSRMDDYLGTDEEDEGYGYDDEPDYYSDESTDMEAGMMDMESEEQAALRIARDEDERELQQETALKKEKLARKKRLEQLSKARQ